MGILPSSCSLKRPRSYHSAWPTVVSRIATELRQPTAVISSHHLAAPLLVAPWIRLAPNYQPVCGQNAFSLSFISSEALAKAAATFLSPADQEQQRTANTPQQRPKIPQNCGPTDEQILNTKDHVNGRDWHHQIKTVELSIDLVSISVRSVRSTSTTHV